MSKPLTESTIEILSLYRNVILNLSISAFGFKDEFKFSQSSMKPALFSARLLEETSGKACKTLEAFYPSEVSSTAKQH